MDNNFLKFLQQTDPDASQEAFADLFQTPNKQPLILEQDYRQYLDNVENEQPQEIPTSISGSSPLSPEQLQQLSNPVNVLPIDSESVSEESSQTESERPQSGVSSQQSPIVPEVKPQQEELPSITNKTLLDEYRELLGKREQDIKDAREQDKKSRMWGALGDILGAAVTTRMQRKVGQELNYKPVDVSGVLKQFEQAPSVEQDYQTKLAGILEQYKMLKDPTEKSAQQSSSFTFLTTPEGVVRVNKLTGEIEEGYKSQLAQDRENRQALETARRMEQFEQSKYERPIKTFNSDNVVKKANERISGSQMAKQLVMSDNPIGHKSVATFLARASGEVGALTEADKAPFGGDQSLKAKLAQTLENYKSGKLTPENQQLIIQLSDTFERQALKDKQNRASAISKQYKFMGKDAGELQQYMLSQYGEPEPSVQNEYNEVQERGIKRVMESNNISREQAIKALKNAGKL